MRSRFNPDLLDPDDPFEIDEGNRPHLYKHLPNEAGRHVAVGIEDIYDVYVADLPIYYEADEEGPADWLMVGEVPALVLIAPLAPPNGGDEKSCRPIGIYSASGASRAQYRKDLTDDY